MMEFGTSEEQPNPLPTPTVFPVIGGQEYEMPFTNEQNNVKYQFVKLYVIIASGTLTFKANIGVLPEP